MRRACNRVASFPGSLFAEGKEGEEGRHHEQTMELGRAEVKLADRGDAPYAESRDHIGEARRSRVAGHFALNWSLYLLGAV